MEDPEDSTQQEEPACNGNGSPCLSSLPCSFQPCCQPWHKGLRVAGREPDRCGNLMWQTDVGGVEGRGRIRDK